MDYHELKYFFTVKETDNKMKRQTMSWKKIFANHIYDRELISKIYKENMQFSDKKFQNNMIIYMGKRNKQTFFQRRHSNSQWIHEKVFN